MNFTDISFYIFRVPNSIKALFFKLSFFIVINDYLHYSNGEKRKDEAYKEIETRLKNVKEEDLRDQRIEIVKGLKKYYWFFFIHQIKRYRVNLNSFA